ncbi:hypothetical protein ANN_03206 [Periplaneta americana]|uniref:Reverse transcriptase domain-containing protein n=1 Tax=Periplaneta americana TaxID=6978 RepID=A0ABQ8TYI3_PERAM|nr:hypothetical protein ANN_03206 [Periplaneta americana]
MSPEYSTESYTAFAHIGLRENPGKNLKQVTCPDGELNLGHLVSRPDSLTVIHRKEKGTLDAIGLLRTVDERYLEKNKELHVVFVDLVKAFDRAEWNKLVEILKKISVDWKEKRLFSNLYMKQRVSQDRRRNIRRK